MFILIYTLEKTNMEHENGPLQEKHIIHVWASKNRATEGKEKLHDIP